MLFLASSNLNFTSNLHSNFTHGFLLVLFCFVSKKDERQDPSKIVINTGFKIGAHFFRKKYKCISFFWCLVLNYSHDAYD